MNIANIKFNKVISPQKHVYVKTCLKQPLKKDKTKILITIGSLMKGKSFVECSPWDIWSFLIGRLRQVLLYNQQSIYI